jgi:type IV pilus assembly protein PilW
MKRTGRKLLPQFAETGPFSHLGASIFPIPSERGFTLVEILVTLGIFSIIMAGVFSAYITQMGHTTREYKVAESEIELGIAKNLILRDLEMAGYGLADDYDGLGFDPRAYGATNGNPDTLTLKGTALGLDSRASQGWTYISDAGDPGASIPPNFEEWGDAREDVRTGTNGDLVILMEPSTKKLLSETVSGSREWLFRYNGPLLNVTTFSGDQALSNPSLGTLVYGLSTTGATTPTKPYSTVVYHMAADPSGNPRACAPGTLSFLRVESRTTETPTGGRPVLACVLDFEVIFGLDTNEDGSIDLPDDGGATAASYSASDQRKRLRQVKVFLLVQSGKRDSGYTYPDTSIHVGDADGGEDVDLTAEQRKYRWRLVALTTTPRNLR